MAVSDGIALTWLLSRHGRYGRAVALHDRLRQHRADRTGRAGAAAPPAAGFVVSALRRLDMARVATWTVRVAVRWVALTQRLARGHHRAETVAGLLAAPLAVPVAASAAAIAAAIIAVVVLIDASVWALFAAGRSVRSIVHRPRRGAAAGFVRLDALVMPAVTRSRDAVTQSVHVGERGPAHTA